jgi:predicted MFS family arabinose efflux permease
VRVSEQVQGALIAAAVGVISALLASYLAWRVERRKRLVGFKANVQEELIKARLASYPLAIQALQSLSRLTRIRE